MENSIVYRPGDRVRIVKEWRDQPDEGEAVFVVVEDNGDRCVIELVCDLPIRPQEIVGKNMIEAA